MYRPLTKTPIEVAQVVAEIEAAGRLKFTGVINNSNLGAATDAQTVLDSSEYAAEAARITGLPLVLTTVEERLYEELKDKVENLWPLKLQKRPV